MLSVFVQNANDRSDDFVLSCFVPESDEPLPEVFPDPQPASKLSDMHRHAPTANNFLNLLIIFTSNIMRFILLTRCRKTVYNRFNLRKF